MKITDLRNHIREAEQNLEQYKRKVARLEQYITAGKRLLAKDTEADDSSVFTVKKKTRKNSIAAKAKPILEAASRAMHVSELVPELEKAGVDLSRNKNKQATVAAALYRRSDEFERTAPNTFSLRKSAA